MSAQAYLDVHRPQLEALLTAAVSKIFRERPDDPISSLAAHVQRLAAAHDGATAEQVEAKATRALERGSGPQAAHEPAWAAAQWLAELDLPQLLAVSLYGARFSISPDQVLLLAPAHACVRRARRSATCCSRPRG